ncbi:MAG: acyl-CoA dehydrogenase family protein, partial [Geminicoccaceae bacterium]
MAVAALHRTPSVAALAAEFALAAAQHDSSGAFPFANFTLLHKAGLLALTVPTHLGGNAAGLAEAARLVGTIAA